VPSISKSNQYASSDLACYFSSSDLVMIYIRNLDWNLSNYSTANTATDCRAPSSSALIFARALPLLRVLAAAAESLQRHTSKTMPHLGVIPASSPSLAALVLCPHAAGNPAVEASLTTCRSPASRISLLSPSPLSCSNVDDKTILRATFNLRLIVF
jgi:hypothetical protein